MDENKLEVQGAAGAFSAPNLPRKKPFSTDWREKTAAFGMYLAAYLYISLFVNWDLTWEQFRIGLVIFAALLVGLTELIHWERRRSWESWVWLGCLTVIAVCTALDHNAVWGVGWSIWFLHICAVWWVMSRSGCLAGGETGHLIPLDGLNGFIVFPFKHLFLRIRTVFDALVCLFRRTRRRAKTETLVWTLVALIAACGLFALAVSLLMAADDNFAGIFSGLAGFFQNLKLWDEKYVFRFVLSLPVGAWLFGLIAGTGRENRVQLKAQGAALVRWLERLRKVPNRVWTVLLGAFCLLYLLFFVIQGQYLFGAFTRTLPEGFIVADYARQGFFELCRVMAVNFALLWLVARLSRTPVREDKPALVLSLLLLAESMLLAVVAFSKLMLYISCFGFTPLRFQSSWLVCVLFFGCVCAGYSLVTWKKSFRIWVMAAAISLTALYLF